MTFSLDEIFFSEGAVLPVDVQQLRGDKVPFHLSVTVWVTLTNIQSSTLPCAQVITKELMLIEAFGLLSIGIIGFAENFAETGPHR